MEDVHKEYDERGIEKPAVGPPAPGGFGGPGGGKLRPKASIHYPLNICIDLLSSAFPQVSEDHREEVLEDHVHRLEDTDDHLSHLMAHPLDTHSNSSNLLRITLSHRPTIQDRRLPSV